MFLNAKITDPKFTASELVARCQVLYRKIYGIFLQCTKYCMKKKINIIMIIIINKTAYPSPTTTHLICCKGISPLISASVLVEINSYR